MAHRDVLFCSNSNSNSVTKTDKEAAWGMVLEKAQSLQMAPANKTWTFARDSLFGVWKFRTLVIAWRTADLH